LIVSCGRKPVRKKRVEEDWRPRPS
jgi:hypothetical protein